MGPMSLMEWRKQASELSGGTSSEVIRRFVIRMLRASGARGSLMDFGAGQGELLRTLHDTEGFQDLAGIDLFERSPDLPQSIAWYTRDLNEPDRKSTRLNSSHGYISYAVFCLKKKKKNNKRTS